MQAYSATFLQQLYTTMLRIRLCEESFVEPILDKSVRCPVHLGTGEEAVATGVCAALSEDDYVFGTHRSHGHYLAKGGSLRELAAEIYGKTTGCSRGRGGSMHLIDREHGMLGAVPIVGATIPLALGAALASFIRGEKRVAVAFFGDGATNEGVFYESLNFAALKKLPLIFVCENNLYSTHMPIRECRPNQEIFRAGQPFDIDSQRVEGNDVLAVYESAREAVERCRSGQGPVLLECLTYRLRGHVGPNDNIQGTQTDIRPPDEVAAWKERDPLLHFERLLREREVLDDAAMQQLTMQVEQDVAAAHEFARNSNSPHESELTHDVFTA